MKKELNVISAKNFAETFGIVEYKIVGNNMVYTVSYPQERTTFKCSVNLETLKETRTQMARYNAKFSYNM